MKNFIKNILNFCCLILIAPFAAMSWLEKQCLPNSETVFAFCAQLLSILPGLPGTFIRRAYYNLTLDHCSLNCIIGFGSLIVHRQAIIEENVSIGNYAVIGAAHISKSCEIGSRVSITSGKKQHQMDDSGKWTPYTYDPTQKVQINQKVWLGEGAIVMANIGEGSLIGAGAVVCEPIPAHVVAAGNPAKTVKKVNPKCVV